MEDAFYLSLLRVSILQILKAAGFDKCKPLVLNTITDIYIRQFEQTLSVAKTFALERSAFTNEMTSPDILEALYSVGLLKPKENESGADSIVNTKSLESFVNWVKYSDIFAVAKKLNTVPAPLLYNLMEKRKIDTSAETDQERKRRRLRERQEFYNQLKQNDDNTDNVNGMMDELEDEELKSNDKLSWLAYLAEKDVKLGQNMKFLNSVIQDDLMAVHKNNKYHPTPPGGDNSYALFQSQVEKSIKNDYIIILLYEAEDKDDKENVVAPSGELTNALPYNVKYSEILLDDDLLQFVEYAEKHEDEISERVASIREVSPDMDEISAKIDEADQLLDGAGVADDLDAEVAKVSEEIEIQEAERQEAEIQQLEQVQEAGKESEAQDVEEVDEEAEAGVQKLAHENEDLENAKSEEPKSETEEPADRESEAEIKNAEDQSAEVNEDDMSEKSDVEGQAK